MAELPAYYTALFNAVTDAISALERQNPDAAWALLIRGQQTAEEAYLRQDGAEKQGGA